MYSTFLQNAQRQKKEFSNFSSMFLNPNSFSNLNYNCSSLLDIRNLQEQVKKAICYQKLFWPFTVWTNCSTNANSQPSASDFKFFSQSLEQFFLTLGQNNLGNKIPFLAYFLAFKLRYVKASRYVDYLECVSTFKYVLFT